MLIAETVIAVTMLCSTAAKKTRSEEEPFYLFSRNSACFHLSSGSTLEGRLTIDLENIDGVGSVAIRRTGNSYIVNVSMETFDFSSYEKVIQKELELSESAPASSFTFNVTFAGTSTDTTSVLNVAAA